MKNPYPPSHPAHAFQEWNYSRIYDKVLDVRGDGSGVILYRDHKGMVLAARGATQVDIDRMEVGVPVVKPTNVAVRKRTRRDR